MTTTYIKVTAIKFDSLLGDTSHSISRTFADAIPTSAGFNPLSVSFNGQEIPKRTAEPTGTFAKYYYEVTSNSYPSASPGLVLSFTANASYIPPGYASGTVSSIFTTDDIIFVEYTYEL